MPRWPTVRVSYEDLTTIFDALDVLAKINSGNLITRPVATSPARNPRWSGGTSYILIHLRRQDNLHIATTHLILDRQGREVHRHGKDILLSGLRFFSHGEPA
jgi:hypothetical protein